MILVFIVSIVLSFCLGITFGSFVENRKRMRWAVLQILDFMKSGDISDDEINKIVSFIPMGSTMEDISRIYCDRYNHYQLVSIFVKLHAIKKI